MKIKRFVKKIRGSILGGTVGFGVGIMAPIVICTAGSYFYVKKDAYVSNDGENETIALFHAITGLIIGCVIEGILLVTPPGAILLLVSGIGCAITGTLLMVSLE